jgi:AraC-like DNA-binding protein
MELEKYITVVEFIYNQNDVVDPHASIWGDFNFCLNGILEYEIEGNLQLSPPSYGLWIPPRTTHHCMAVDQNKTHYVGIRIHPDLCDYFSKHAEILAVRPFFRNLVEEIISFQSNTDNMQQYRHLLQVLLDQLVDAPKYNHYLPQSHHPILKDILQTLTEPQNLALNLKDALAEAPITERHLLRLCQQELNLSISEWRNRAKILYAITQLRQGHSIKKVGYDLGYNHSSSFIEFFKRHTDQTPNQLKFS